MSALRIIPLSLGTLPFDRSFMTYMQGAGTPIEVPLLAYLIRGGEQDILVDTGPPDPEWCRLHHRPIRQTPEQRLDAALGAVGVDPADVGIVVMSHLHWDHCGANSLFPDATFYVQRSELRYAAAPLPTHVRPYQAPETGLDPLWRGTRFTVVDGDREIAPGVTLIFTPGHSPGCQTVVVEAESTTYVLPQDMVPLYDNWNGSGHVPTGIHVDLEDCFASMARIASYGGEILPGHDAAVLERERYA
jgi:N-acyl homoserine lactone hydrolase